MSFGNAVAGAGQALSTRSQFNLSRDICRAGYARLQRASSLSKKPGTNSTLESSPARSSKLVYKTRAGTKSANKFPVTAAHPRFVSPATNKTNLVVRPAASSRPPQNNTTYHRQDGFRHTMLEDTIWRKDSQIISLPSGAQLSYARLGCLKEVGQYWVCFHGTPNSRLGGKAVHKYAENHGVRIIAVDRPGYGHSSLHDRGILGFIQDVEHLLDYHDIQEFKVLGVSGGGTYALAAAYHFPKSRLKKTSIMCGTNHSDFTPTEVSMRHRLRMWLRAWTPFVSGANFRSLQEEIAEAKGNEKQILYAILQYQEKFRQGAQGYDNDIRLALRPWGYDLEDIDANPIRWYHGAVDVNTSLDAARKTAEAANRYRRNIDFRECAGLDHWTPQTEKYWENLEWMLK